MSDDEKLKLDLLREQYRIYRDETHKYLAHAAGSPAYLHAFILAELGAAYWGEHPSSKIYLLIPLTFISYLALLSLLYLYALVSANYSGLLEDRINIITKRGLADQFFIFESHYSTPKPFKKSAVTGCTFDGLSGFVNKLDLYDETRLNLILWFGMFLLPIAITAYAFSQLWVNTNNDPWLQYHHVAFWTLLTLTIAATFGFIIIFSYIPARRLIAWTNLQNHK